MACSALLLVTSCIATNNHCLSARDGAAAQLQCVPLSGTRLTTALGTLALAFNLLGASVGWITVGGFARWLSRQPVQSSGSLGYAWPYTCKADTGCSLTGVALAGNLLALCLAVRASYAAPPQAQQLVEGSDQEPGGAGSATAGRLALEASSAP